MEMSEEKIKIKGENGGLSLAFPAAMPFSEIMEELGKKLDSGAGFFLRGSQAIETEGSVIVFGNVNPGAQITAGGSIDVRGTCRGVIHAGAAGDSTAFIIADRLMPTQIRIANYVARSPDEPEDSGKAERAYVKDGQIVIEPIER